MIPRTRKTCDSDGPLVLILHEQLRRRENGRGTANLNTAETVDYSE
jgi:hypothetical protein